MSAAPMRILFYAPFKPLGHPHPSGDLIIAGGLFEYLSACGHHLRVVSRLRARWIFWKPWLWPLVLRDRRRALRFAQRSRPQLWLTYHAYYKAPDLIGPWVCRRYALPYVIFQPLEQERCRRYRADHGLYRPDLCEHFQ